MLASKTIVVFAKLPRPGHVKTRLTSVLSPAQAAALHRVCLEDTAALVRSVAGCAKWFLVAGTIAEARALAKELRLSSGWTIGAQRGRDLGERMGNALRTLFAAGARKVVIVGTDTPWMGPQRILQAFRALDSADIVFGPAADGGYYLVGARRLLPAMFRGIPWGRSGVIAATLRALSKSHIRYRLLPRDFDLDRPDDLERAANLLRQRPERSPSLANWIERLRAPAEKTKKKPSRSSRRPAPAHRNRKPRPVRG